MKQPSLISIIIPVYNGERYLRPCIDSIVGQTYTEWELLLVDDGSTDGSGDICDEYAAEYEQITVLHKKNGGQASARNEGINRAKGDFISFVDCDDWLEPDMYETMVGTLNREHADAIVCGYIEEYPHRQKAVHTDGQLTVYDSREALKQILQGRIGSYLWSMLFRRDIVQEPMPDLNLYEDHATIFKWISHAGKVAVLHQAFYHYRQLQSSSLHSYNPKKGNHFFLAIKERYHYVEDHRLLPGWERENRNIYIRNCIKLAKDLARMDSYDAQMRHIICEVREELRSFLPVRLKDVGLKQYIRLKLLMLNVNAFVNLLRCSSLFSFVRKSRKSA